MNGTHGYDELNKGFGGIIDASTGHKRVAFNNDDKTDSIGSDFREQRRDIREELSVEREELRLTPPKLRWAR